MKGKQTFLSIYPDKLLLIFVNLQLCCSDFFITDFVDFIKASRADARSSLFFPARLTVCGRNVIKIRELKAMTVIIYVLNFSVFVVFVQGFCVL